MIVEINESMDDYFDTTDAITAALREENSPILQTLHVFDAYFRKTLCATPVGSGRWQWCCR